MSEIESKHQQREQQQQPVVLKPGASAPDFTLHSKPGESVPVIFHSEVWLDSLVFALSTSANVIKPNPENPLETLYINSLYPGITFTPFNFYFNIATE